MVDVISAGVLGKSIWWVCDHVSGGALSTFQQAALERMRFPRQARSNHDLHRALQDAFPIAIESLVRSSSEDQQVYLGQIREGGSALLRNLHSDFPNRLLDALLYEEAGSEAWRTLWSPLETMLDGRETRPYFKAARLTLEHRLQDSFANVLRTDKYRRAVVAYQQAMLGEVVGALKDESRALPEHIAAVEALQSVPDLINQATDTVLAAIQARDQGDAHIRDRSAQQLGEMIRVLQDLCNQVAGSFIRANGQAIDVSLHDTCERVRETLVSRPLRGREAELRRLTEGVSEPVYIAVAGVAGMGKSSLLAHWIDEIKEHQNVRVCNHFFSRTRDTDQLSGGMACIAEQLLAAHGISGDVSESEPERLKVVIRKVLEMPHREPLVIVIDGLDEITDFREASVFALRDGWFPVTLGENVHVVFGVRFGPGLEDLEALRVRLGVGSIRRFDLDILGEEAIREMIRKPFHPLARAIFEQTEGLAVYAAAVADAVNQASDLDHATTELDRLPLEFSDYANDALDAATDDRREWLDPLGFLAVASGPLTRRELLRLCSSSEHRLRERDLRQPPWGIARWLTRVDDGWSYQHDAIADARRAAMEYELASFRARLLHDCANWETHNDPYSLTNYPGDLLLAIEEDLTADSAWGALRELAQNYNYFEAQRRQTQNQPGLPLTTVQTAIRAAHVRGDSVATVDLMLTHYDLVIRYRREPPMTAAQAGNLERAIWLATLGEPEQAAFDLLSIAWHFDAKGKPEYVARTMRELELLSAFTFRGWQGTACWTIFTHTSSIRSNQAVRQWLLSRLDSGDLVQLVEQLVACGEFKDAKELTSHISQDLQVWALASIALNLAFSGDLANAQATFNEARKIADTILDDAWAQANSDAILALQLTLNEEISRAVKVVTSFPDEVQRVSALALIAQLLAATGRQNEASEIFDKAESFVVRITDEWQQANALSAIARCLAATGQDEAALITFAKARELASQISEDWRKSAVLATIAEHLATSGRIRDALEIAASILVIWRRAEALAFIARQIAVSGQPENAQEIFAEARKFATSLSDEIRKDWALEAIVEHLARIGQLHAAWKIAASIHDLEERVINLGTIAKHLAAAGNVDDAQQAFSDAQRIAASIDFEWSRADAFGSIAQNFAAVGCTDEARNNFAKAREAVYAIDDARDRANHLSALALCLDASGEPREAEVAFAEAKDTSASFSGEFHVAIALADIAKDLAASGRVDDAQGTLAEARVIASSLPDTWQQAHAFGQIVSSLAASKQFEEARSIATGIGNDTELSRALGSLAGQLALSGQFLIALEVAREIPSDPDRAKTLSFIAWNIAKDGNSDDARVTISEAWQIANDIVDEQVQVDVRSSITAATIRSSLPYTPDMLIACAHPDADVWQVAAEIARANPDEAGEIGRAIAQRSVTANVNT